MGLTAEQKAFYQEQGYLVIEEIFSAEEVENMRNSVDELIALSQKLSDSTDRLKLSVFGEEKTVLQQVAEPHEVSPTWFAVARDPRILDAVEALVGPNIQLYYSQMFPKLARQGAKIPWHQDMAYFPHNRADDILGCQVYMDDANEENGCLRVVPGSHKLGLLNHYKDSRFSGICQRSEEYDASGKHTAVSVEAGGILLFHCLTLHSSLPNTSDRPRRMIVYEYKNPESHLMSGAFNTRLEVRPVGTMVRGRDPSGQLLGAF